MTLAQNHVQLVPAFGRLDQICDNLQVVGILPNRPRIIPGALVWGASGLVLDETGNPLEEPIWSLENLVNCPNPKNWRRFLPIHKKGDWYSTMLYWGNGYYHWICDVLPRIQRDLAKLPKSTRLIVSSDLRSWQIRSLELIGVNLENCVPFHGSRPWFIERLHHSSPLAMTGDHDRNGIEMLRKAIFFGLKIDDKRKFDTKKIYISRAAGTERHVENETVILPVLKQFGIEVVRCESLSFDEQARVFHNAKFIMGPHGAGFANMTWTQANATVFEVFAPGSIRRCFKTLADALGFRHHCAVAASGRQIGGSSSIVIDPSDLHAALDSILNKAPGI